MMKNIVSSILLLLILPIAANADAPSITTAKQTQKTCEALINKLAESGNIDALNKAMNDPKCTEANKVIKQHEAAKRTERKKEREKVEAKAIIIELAKYKKIPLKDKLSHGPNYRKWENSCNNNKNLGFLGCSKVKHRYYSIARKNMVNKPSLIASTAAQCDSLIKKIEAEGSMYMYMRGMSTANECDAVYSIQNK